MSSCSRRTWNHATVFSPSRYYDDPTQIKEILNCTGHVESYTHVHTYVTKPKVSSSGVQMQKPCGSFKVLVNTWSSFQPLNQSPYADAFDVQRLCVSPGVMQPILHQHLRESNGLDDKLPPSHRRNMLENLSSLSPHRGDKPHLIWSIYISCWHHCS